MGIVSHHCIVVASWDENALAGAHQLARKTFRPLVAETNPQSEIVSPIISSPVNGWTSFYIAPDGSKEGWEESDQGNEMRETFIKWLDSQRYSDGSFRFSWFECVFGSEVTKSFALTMIEKILNNPLDNPLIPVVYLGHEHSRTRSIRRL